MKSRHSLSFAALVMAVAMLLGCMAGCGAPAQSDTPQTPVENTPTPDIPETPEEPEFNFDYTGYTMVWSDEFDAPELNRYDWNV